MRDLVSNKGSYISYINSLRTEQERIKNVEILNSILDSLMHAISQRLPFAF